MKKWLLLAAAILLEVTATLSLRGAIDNQALYAVVAVGYIGALSTLGSVLREGMALGVAYGIWGASGVALTAVMATILFGDPLTALMGLGLVVIVAGVLCVEFGSQAAHARRIPEPEESTS